MRHLFAIIFILILPTSGAALPAVSNNVYALEDDGRGKLLAGGAFEYIGEARGALALIDENGAQFDCSCSIAGVVHKVISDGAGGWYVGGYFQELTSGLSNLIRISADGAVDTTFQPEPNTSVWALARSNTTLFAAGAFSYIAGEARDTLAGLDLTTGEATILDVEIDGYVDVLAAVGTGVVLGGEFTSVGGEPLRNLALVNASTNDVLELWAPNPNAPVKALAYNSGNLVLQVGGSFTETSGQLRNYFAFYYMLTGALVSAAPDFNGSVRDIVLNNGLIHVTGTFSTVDGNERVGYAAFDATSAALQNTSIESSYSFYGNGIAVKDTEITIVGQIEEVNGSARVNMAAFDPADGSLTDTYVPLSNPGYTAAYSTGGRLAIGGAFPTFGSDMQARSGLLELNSSDEVSSEEFAGFAGDVLAMERVGDRLFVGGSLFVSINGEYEYGLAEFDLKNRVWVRGFGATGSVAALHAHKGRLYVGGYVTELLGESVGRFAVIDLKTNQLVPHEISFDNQVTSIVAAGNRVFVGGYFAAGNGIPQAYLVALNAKTLALESAPEVNDAVFDLAADGQVVYASGDFTTVAGTQRSRFVAFNAKSGALESFAPQFDYAPRDVAPMGKRLLVAGGYYEVNDQSTSNSVILDRTSASVLLEGTEAHGSPLCIGIINGAVLAGGNFQRIGEALQPYLGTVLSITKTAMPRPLVSVQGGRVVVTPRRSAAGTLYLEVHSSGGVYRVEAKGRKKVSLRLPGGRYKARLTRWTNSGAQQLSPWFTVRR